MASKANFRPMLAATMEMDLIRDLQYPLLVSPKLDGIRCLIHPTLGPVSRTLKPIPNKFIREYLYSQSKWKYLDGELIIGQATAPDVFKKTQSGVMSHDGEPDFKYFVFDHFDTFTMQCAYHMRLGDLNNQPYLSPRIHVLQHDMITCPEHLERYVTVHTLQGYEGVMLRSLGGKYKCGRATFKEATFYKLKPLKDGEAKITGYDPLLLNQNEATIDVLGLQRRGYSAAGKVVDPTRCGRFNVVGCSSPWIGVEFNIGSGLDDDLRRHIVDTWPLWKGKIISYTYQLYGSDEKPRQPIFKGERKD